MEDCEAITEVTGFPGKGLASVGRFGRGPGSRESDDRCGVKDMTR